MVTGGLGTLSVQKRLEGFRKVALKQGISLYEINTQSLPKSVSGEPDFNQISENLTVATAYFCVNDSLAIQLMQYYKDQNIAIPEEKSFIGVDDSFLCRHVQPSLSSVSQSSKKMGSKAAELLFDLIDNKTNGQETTQIILTPSFIERQSVMNYHHSLS